MTMPTPPDPLDQWMRAVFDQCAADPGHYVVFTRFFQRQLEEVRKWHKVDPVIDRTTLLQADEPNFGTWHQAVAEDAVKVFGHYLATLAEGHVPAWAESLAMEFDEREECASMVAYEKIRLSCTSSPEDPAYQDAYQACIIQGSSEVDAKRCAEFIFAYDFSFKRAKKAAEDFAAVENSCFARGWSPMRARIHAEVHLSGRYTPEAVELYARTMEERIADGYTEDEAGTFTDAYMDYHDREGSPDDEKIDPYVAVFAEAHIRWSSDCGDRDHFVCIFAILDEKLPCKEDQSPRERYDEIEKQTREIVLRPRTK